jgi:formate-dependent nitrite reductase membrane component NrfD
MKKLFSIPVYIVLSIIVSLLIIFLYEAHYFFRVFGGAVAAVSIANSSVIFVPRQRNEIVELWDQFVATIIYLIFLSGGIITAAANYYEMYDSATFANLNVVIFPGASAALLGIIYLIGTEKVIPALEKRKRRKVYKAIRGKMDSIEEGFMHLD